MVQLHVMGLSVLCACASAMTGQRPPPESPAGPSREPTKTLPPLPAPAATYGGDVTPRDAPASAFESRILAEVAAAHPPMPVIDARLDRAAAVIAQQALDGVPSDAETRALLAHFGVLESTRILVERFGIDEELAWEDLRVRLRGELEATDRIIGLGVAERGGEKIVVLCRQRGALTVTAFPREIGVGAAVRLEGRIDPTFSDLQIVVTEVGGEVRVVPVVAGVDRSFHAELRCPAVGTLAVRMVAHDARQADRLLADVRVYCGEPAPTEIDSQPRSVAGLEMELLARANQTRQERGLPALVLDETASAAARAHAAAMRDRGVVNHKLPGRGTLAEQAQHDGLVSPIMLENVARAETAEQAEIALLAAPASRDNLLSPECTHVGIGVAPALTAGSSGEAVQLYLAELYFARAAPVAHEAAQGAVLANVAAARAQAKLPPLAEDTDLAAAAQRAADALAAGSAYPSVATHIKAMLRIRPSLQSVLIVHTVTASLSDPLIGSSALVLDHEIIGVGVARVTSAAVGRGSLVVVLLIARP